MTEDKGLSSYKGVLQMLVLTQSQRMAINTEYVDCMFIQKEIKKYGLYFIMASDQEKVAIAYYETEKEAMEELKLMLTCRKQKQDAYFIKQEKAVLS